MLRDTREAAIEVVDERIAAILRTKTPTERLEMVFKAYGFARRLAETGARHVHPTWTDDQIRIDVNRRMSRGSA